MAEEGSEASVATSSFTPNWWELHTNSLSSWNNTSPWHPPNPSSNSSCEEEFSISPSFTNASNQSGLSVDSSSQLVEPASSSEIMGEPTSEWSQVLLSVQSSGDLHNDQDVGENFLHVLSSKDLSTEMFEPACDYLKKMDSDWEFPNSTSFSCNSEKELNVFNGSLMENERLANLSNLVSNWSIAPPGRQEFIHQINPLTWESDISLNSSMDQYYSEPDLSQRMKQILAAGNSNSYFLPCYGKDVKPEIQHQEIEASGLLFPRSFNRNRVGQMGVNSSVVVGDNKYNNRISDASWSNARKFSEHISFNGCLSKPLLDIQDSKPCLKASNSPDSKKKGHDTPLTTAKGNGRGKGVTNEGKKKRSEENSETLFKRPKHETSTVSSLKGPKVKLGDRIAALQQIVSPFGKTDTASVLLEAIGYIKFLQEQVQVLSNPYMKSNKDHPWGSQLDQRKDHKTDAKLDLKSRGLCLVPISCTPQVYRENTGSDYWTPTYRGCLYR